MGEFVGTSAAAELSRSAMFSGQSVAVVARFSVGAGNPDVPDVDSSLPRGMALEFHLRGDVLQHMTMVNIHTGSDRYGVSRQGVPTTVPGRPRRIGEPVHSTLCGH